MKFLFVFLFATIMSLTASSQCPAPTGGTATVTPTTVDFSWNAGSYPYYRLQYKKTSCQNCAWTLRLITANQANTSVLLSSLGKGTYIWGVRGFCSNWSPVTLGTFTVPNN